MGKVVSLAAYRHRKATEAAEAQARVRRIVEHVVGRISVVAMIDAHAAVAMGRSAFNALLDPEHFTCGEALNWYEDHVREAARKYERQA